MSKSKKSDTKPEPVPEHDTETAATEPDQGAQAPSGADMWSEAMAEQQAAEPGPDAQEPAADVRNAEADVFQPLDASAESDDTRELEMIMDIPVQLSVELGRTRLTIKELLKLAQGSVVELDGLPGEPMDILINGYLIAQGEVVVVDDKYGIRISEIVTPSARLQKLSR